MSDDPLRELETAARDAMLRVPRWPAGAGTCSVERLLAALLIDTLLGLVCLFGGGWMFGAILETIAPNMPGHAGDSLFSLFVTCCPLIYSSMDWVIGNTPGKAMLGVRIESPMGSRTATFKRWAIKGAPFIVAAAMSAIELSQAIPVGIPLFVIPPYLLVIAVWCIVVGCVWWLVGSIVLARSGQTFPDVFAGTRLVRHGSQLAAQGFEPVLIQGH